MTLSGLRNRLGRSVVTWLGIVLGIAFLMSSLMTTSIRSRLADLAERRLDVESMLAILRIEVGHPDGKQLVLIAPAQGAPSPLADLLDRLREMDAPPVVVGPLTTDEANDAPDAFDGAHAVLDGSSRTDDPAWARHLPAMHQQVVLAPGRTDALAAALGNTARVRTLLPELTGDRAAQRDLEQQRRRSRHRWLVAISLLVATIGIANALLMSVTERFREIGTMKCLGALNRFIIRLLLLESSALGLSGAAAGMIAGALFALAAYAFTYDLPTVLAALEIGPLIGSALICLVLGWFVAMVAVIYPAIVAARMVPADALRSEV